MAAPMDTGIPEALDLEAGYTVRFTALDPTTGALVANVVISDASLYVTNVRGGDLSSGFEDVAPLWVPLPANLFAAKGSGSG